MADFFVASPRSSLCYSFVAAPSKSSHFLASKVDSVRVLEPQPNQKAPFDIAQGAFLVYSTKIPSKETGLRTPQTHLFHQLTCGHSPRGEDQTKAGQTQYQAWFQKLLQVHLKGDI